MEIIRSQYTADTPWLYDHGDDRPEITIWPDSLGDPIATVHCRDPHQPTEEEFANAYLISAAPDLLQACANFAAAIDGYEQRTGNKQYHPCLDEALAAIAKATGNTP